MAINKHLDPVLCFDHYIKRILGAFKSRRENGLISSGKDEMQNDNARNLTRGSQSWNNHGYLEGRKRQFED